MLKGWNGEFVARRLGRVILIRVDAGVYVEMSELLARALGREHHGKAKTRRGGQQKKLAS